MSVTSKKWRLRVTPLTGNTPLHQLEVEAANWMGALREARKELGEEGGLPTGASCAVAPDGTVTILDSEARRKFLLVPATASTRAFDAPARVASSPRNPAVQKGATNAPKKRGDTVGYEQMAPGRRASSSALRRELDLLFTRNEEPTPDNPLTYRERAYVIPPGMSVSEAEAKLRFTLADLQEQIKDSGRGRFINLAAFDHRWVDQPERPPLVVLEWRDWRGEPIVDYPAAEHRSQSPRANAEPDDRLASVFEALHELPHMQTPHEAMELGLSVLESTVGAEAMSGCLYDINTDEMRFVAMTGPGAEQRRGTALPLTQGIFSRAARDEHAALVVQDLSEAPDFDPERDGREGLVAENLLFRPVAHEGRLLGMLQLINRSSGYFSAADVHLVSYIADRLAEYLHQARTRARR
jgi:GAF domain-containing protein